MPIASVSPDLRRAVLTLSPAPEQEQWCASAAQTLPEAEVDPLQHPIVILAQDGIPAGFFILDQNPSPADPSADLMVRALFVDRAYQRHGIGGRALAGLPHLVRAAVPGARTVGLTVNIRNPVARDLYLRHGFTDAGELYLGGDAGPQHVLRLNLTGEPPRAALSSNQDHR
ncbi:MAG: hypothetical protein QOE58_3396 [Actinomycetota bacterium]|jgi:GNAT superfamily N-acetyltransferase|nr:hypothetical protein [Actinomycetota bacterium]